MARGDNPFAGSDTPQTPTWRRWIWPILAGIVFTGFGAVVWIATEDPPPPAEIPVIRALEGPAKMRPEDPGGMVVPHQDLTVYDALEAGSDTVPEERLGPEPEPPVPIESPIPEPSADGAGEPRPQRPDAVASVPAPLSENRLGDAAADDPFDFLEVGPEPVPAPQTGTAPGGWQVQLGSFRTDKAASEAWTRIKAQAPAAIGELEPEIARADLGPERGVYYRLRAGRFGDRASAAALCAELAAKSVDCLATSR